MTVKHLKVLLATVSDEALVVARCSDHEYRPVTAESTTALFDKKFAAYTEDFGEDLTPSKTYGKRVPVLLIT